MRQIKTKPKPPVVFTLIPKSGSVATAQATGHPVPSQFVLAALGIPHAAHSSQENHFLGVSTLLLLAASGVC